MQIGMIDTIEVSISVLDYEKTFCNFLKLLDQKKEEANQRRKIKLSDKVTITMNKEAYKVNPTGAPNYAYILNGEYYDFKFAKYQSENANFYPVHIRIRSVALWEKSPMCACNEISIILDSINEEYNNNSKELYIKERVKRVDLCCHTDHFYLDIDRLRELQGRYINDDIKRTNKIIGTYYIGVRNNPIFCRIYNKSLEIMKSKKLWFIDIWNKNKMNSNKVWNIEFQINREMLKDTSIDSFEDLFSGLKTLWKYCTESWLLHKKLINTRIKRCPVSEEWTEIQKAFDDYKDEKYVERGKHSEITANQLAPIILGYVIKYASIKNIMNYEEALEDVIYSMDIHMDRKNIDFVKEVEKKKIS